MVRQADLSPRPASKVSNAVRREETSKRALANGRGKGFDPAFIYACSRTFRRQPAEIDMQRRFRVSPLRPCRQP
jgi:hypothetical protein